MAPDASFTNLKSFRPPPNLAALALLTTALFLFLAHSTVRVALPASQSSLRLDFPDSIKKYASSSSSSFSSSLHSSSSFLCHLITCAPASCTNCDTCLGVCRSFLIPHLFRVLFVCVFCASRLHINIGPNTSPITPPDGKSDTAVLAVEANIGVANELREKHQKGQFPSRFFVINCAIAGNPLAGGFQTFRFFNRAGQSSSLAPIKRKDGNLPKFATFDPNEDQYGPGPAGVDFVPVLSLENLLSAIPEHLEIPFLKIDTQGFDLAVVKSASRSKLRRVSKIMTETYLPSSSTYEGVTNELIRDWIPHMRTMGYKLSNPTTRTRGEYDAVWERIA